MADPIDPETGRASIRLFVPLPLAAGHTVSLSPDQTHYLRNVMRQSVGDHVKVFNGEAGEWLAQITDIDRRGCDLSLEKQLRQQTELPDLWLLFAPLKKARLDYVAQKATEMGACRLQPVITARTQVARLNADRVKANAIEAAEQCNCLSIPKVCAPLPLRQLLDEWSPSRRILYCDESPDAQPVMTQLSQSRPGPWALLLGPEGGFAPEERSLLKSKSFVVPVSLGPRIMRADTAAVAALAIWQALLGDWR